MKGQFVKRLRGRGDFERFLIFPLFVGSGQVGGIEAKKGKFYDIS